MSTSREAGPGHDASEGFTIVEFLISALITISVAAAIFGFVGPAQRMFQSQPEQSDLQQRLRVGADTLTKDLVMAGAGTYGGPAAGALNYHVAPVMPYRAFGDAPDPARNTYFRTDAISFLYVPSTPSQTTLTSALPSGGLEAALDLPPNCPATTAAQMCGLGRGDRVLILDESSQWDVFSVEQVGSGTIALAHRGPPSSATYEAGAMVAEVTLGSYFLESDDADGVYQLRRHDGWDTELPVVDNVVALEFKYFGDPEPPRLTGTPLDELPGPWTTYGPAPPAVEDTRGGWPAGENCTFLVVDGEHRPRLAVLGGSLALVELTSSLLSDGPWCPDALAPNRFDADLLRIRMVRITLRVQSALDSLRGPAGPLFRKGGTARAGERYVPDLEVQFDVTPRNLNLGR